MHIAPITINRDVNATRKMVRERLPSKEHVLARSAFLTIQGEGPHAGSTAWFLRLGGCNLGSKTTHCAGCDTDFALDKSTPTPIAELVETFKKIEWPGTAPLKLCVITGGEPSLHENLPELVQALLRAGAVVQLETNGYNVQTLLTVGNLPRVSIVLSPKASKKGYSPSLAPQHLAYSSQRDESLDFESVQEVVESMHYKFVVSADPQNEHHRLPEWITNPAPGSIRPCRVYISPAAVYKRPYEGEVSSAWDHTLIDAEATAANYRYAAEVVMRYGFRLSIQQHLFAAIA